MTRALLLLAISLLSPLAFTAASHSPRFSSRKGPAGPLYRAGEILVRPKARIADIRGRQKLASRYGVARVAALGGSGYVRMRLSRGQSVESMVEQLKRDPDVEDAQPNFIYHALAAPNDTNYGNLWGLANTGQTIAGASYATNNPGTAGKDISAESAWAISTDCSSVTVAVIDTGVNYNHDDLSANMWTSAAYPNHGYDFVDSDNNPMDLNGHGTHVAGTIGAVGNNATGMTGVCWTASLMAVRVLDASGSGTTSDIVQGVNFAVAQGAKVINMSLGGSSYDSAFNTALNSAASAGVVIVVAAGNDGTNNDGGSPTYPCNYTTSTLVCVAALDQSFSLASFSNYGSSSVDVGAPGTNIQSTWNGTTTSVTDDFTAGWTTNDATWASQNVMFGGNPYDILSNPAAWDGSSATYANNADGRAYKTFDLTGIDSASLSYYAVIDTQSSNDYFYTAYATTAADPFAGTGTQLDQLSGTTLGDADYFSYDLSHCLVANCTVGFRLTSNASTVSYGVGIFLYTIDKLTLDTTSYNIIDGTSMATPVVAGVAALVYAYNPDYTATDVVAAIKNGGAAVTALSGKSTSGKAVNALGALEYIVTPTGLGASLQ
jgi:subtilisin family serine protease